MAVEGRDPRSAGGATPVLECGSAGIDFQTLFEDQSGRELRFLSALRMSATFPYITPNTTLPTDPPIHIMDAGISDNQVTGNPA